jgi:predicted nucleic acid-binding protein
VIILDTNVIFEAMRPKPDPGVLLWLASHPLGQFATTAINLAEIKAGLARLPFGKRRHDLEVKFDSFAAGAFANRIFNFDAAAANAYADLVLARTRVGRPLGPFDSLIAAIAKSRGLSLATRNVGDFEGCGVEITNPWDAAMSPG